MRQSKSLIVFFLEANFLLVMLTYGALSIAMYYFAGPAFLKSFWLKNSIWFYCAIIWIPIFIIIVNLLMLHQKIISYLENIIELNQRTEEGDFSLFPESCIPEDEIGELLHGRNRMLSQLEHSQSDVETELKGARERLKMTSKRSSVGEMSIAISHELKDPVKKLGQHIEEIRDALVHPTDAKQERAIHEVESAQEIIKSIKSLVRQLHDFDASKEVWENRELNEAVENLMTLVSKQLDLSGVQFSSELKARHSICYVEISLIKHVMLCLISNAVDATRGQDVRAINIKTYSTHHEFIMEVVDNGPGISPENQEKIFSPFFTTKSEDDTTGVGLSAALDIMERHKGKLELESVEGLGAKFIMKLPITIKR